METRHWVTSLAVSLRPGIVAKNYLANVSRYEQRAVLKDEGESTKRASRLIAEARAIYSFQPVSRNSRLTDDRLIDLLPIIDILDSH